MLSYILSGPGNMLLQRLFSSEIPTKVYSSPDKLTHTCLNAALVFLTLSALSLKLLTQSNTHAHTHTHTHTHTVNAQAKPLQLSYI